MKRWTALANRAYPDLSTDPGWPALSAVLHQAQSNGVDIDASLPALITKDPLPRDHAARTLEYRLRNTYPVPSPAARRDEQATASARDRLALGDRQVIAARSFVASGGGSKEPLPTSGTG